MSDFITLICPSCGGKLEVSSNTLSLVCLHCNSEHLIRREEGGVFLEAYARCPKCNRNDKSIKATGATGKRLWPPEKPEMPSRPGFAAGSVILLVLTLFCGGAYFAAYILDSLENKPTRGEQTFAIILFIVAAIIIMIVYPRYRAAQGKYRLEEKAYKRSMEKHKAVDVPNWERGMKRWEQIYYCERDDCVFVPGENTISPVSNLNEYLYRFSQNN